MSRTQKSIKNIWYAVVGQIVGLLIGFISRKVFVDTLSSEHLGLNGLFTNILSMLSITELGIGSAIIYSMYKPLAERNYPKLKSLMNLYKKAYTVIGVIILVAGLALTPFIRFFLKDVPDVPESIYIIYMMYVANSAFSYFLIYRRSLIIADQNRYIATAYRYGMYVVMNILQMIFLIITKNYYVYMGIALLCTVSENLMVSYKAKKMYPFLAEGDVEPLDKEEYNCIKKNVSAIVLHKIGGAFVTGTDNILISKLVGLVMTGLYSNYYLIVNALSTVCGLGFQSITASFGNLNVTASDEHKVRVFNRIQCLGAWFATVTTTCLIVMISPFVCLWLGDEFVFAMPLTIIIATNYFIKTIRHPILVAKETMGFFWEDRFRPLGEAVINIIVSIVMCRLLSRFGSEYAAMGIFIGTAASSLTLNVWIEPYVVYKKGFHCSVAPYFIGYIKSIIATAISTLISLHIQSFLPLSIWCVVLGGIVSSIVSTAVYVLLHFRDYAFKEIIVMIKTYTKKIKGKFLRK